MSGLCFWSLRKSGLADDCRYKDQNGWPLTKVRYYNELTGKNLTWSQMAAEEILRPLNMTHSFFGPVPDSLIPSLTVPGGDNWADLVVGEGYNPAAGMWVRS